MSKTYKNEVSAYLADIGRLGGQSKSNAQSIARQGNAAKARAKRSQMAQERRLAKGADNVPEAG